MEILSGILPGQVLQRNQQDVGAAVITGVTSAAGEVEFRLRGSGTSAAWQIAGRADGGTFRAAIKAVPVGGPYVLELRVRSGKSAQDRLAVPDVFCGDVWFMGGQSNMQGYGNMADAPKPHPMVRAFFMRDEWDIASEPMHHLAEAVDSFHNGYGRGAGRPSQKELDKSRQSSLKGVSPGLYFGLEMQRRTGVPQGLVACAHGGTSMAQWSPALRDQGGASLYGAMLRRFKKLGQPIRGILWYQGESDVGDASAAVYTDRMIELVAATRRDMKQPDLPWFTVQLGCYIARDNGGWNRMQEQQRLLPTVIRNLEVAPAVDLQLDDGIHISGKGQAILGKRLARLAEHLALRVPDSKGSIRFKSLKHAIVAPFPGEPNVLLLTLAYDGVAGSLQSAGLPGGFAILDGAGKVQDVIYKTRLFEDKVLIEIQGTGNSLSGRFLSYGHGCYSHCNVTDAEGMSIPAMSGIKIHVPFLPYALNWQVARLHEAETIEGITYKTACAASGWNPAAIESGCVVLPRPLIENRDGVFSYKTTVKAADACDAKLLFGADSPFILWLNGKEVMRDPQATNPCNPSEYKKQITLKKGDNEIVVVFDSRQSRGWGICLFFESVRKSDKLIEWLTY